MHHNLDIHPIPDKTHLFINELSLADSTADIRFVDESQARETLENPPSDTIRVYVPLDISPDLIIGRLKHVYDMLGDLNEDNEADFDVEVGRLIAQLEIFDQIHVSRKPYEATKCGIGHRHSAQGIELAGRIVRILEEHEGNAECFPYELIDDLKGEYSLKDEL